MVNCRKEHSCVYLNGKVYVISGYDGKNKGMAGCECYDIFRE
jgi:N-acetylneuraminic acid mutarotase